MTSDPRTLLKSPGVAPEAPSSELMIRYDDPVPWRTASPQATVASASRVRMARFIALALQDAWSDEDQKLAALVLRRLAPEEPAEQRDPADGRSLVALRLLPAHEDAADNGRRAVLDLH